MNNDELAQSHADESSLAVAGMDSAWGTEEAKPVPPETLDEIVTLQQEALDLTNQSKELEDQAKLKKARVEEIKGKLVAYLSHHEIPNVRTKLGLVSKSTRYSVKTPKEEQDRAAFFEWLKAEGVYDEVITVNSQTLNGLYNERRKMAADSGEVFEMPGIGAPVVMESVTFRK